MIAHRRTWLYLLAGEKFAHVIAFKIPVTARMVREQLTRTLGVSNFEIWAR